jgi:hypothetical protein
MEANKVKYLVDHYHYLVPLEIQSKLKYPSLQEFEIEEEKNRISELLIRDYLHDIYFNNYPVCRKLARTLKAKQCRFCGHDWHYIIDYGFRIWISKY